MANGGGPACLRLRVPLSDAALAAVDARFLASPRALDAAEAVVERWWPERIAPTDLAEPELWEACAAARGELLAALGFATGEIDAVGAPLAGGVAGC
jgi:succinylarginine dihydrolase